MESICVLKDIYKALYQFEKDFSDVHHITINEAMLLCCLKEGYSKTAGSISEYIGLSNSRVSKIITSVENKGFIDREISKEDKRQMLFCLTETGKKKVAHMQSSDLNIEELYIQLRACIQRMNPLSE